MVIEKKRNWRNELEENKAPTIALIIAALFRDDHAAGAIDPTNKLCSEALESDKKTCSIIFADAIFTVFSYTMPSVFTLDKHTCTNTSINHSIAGCDEIFPAPIPQSPPSPSSRFTWIWIWEWSPLKQSSADWARSFRILASSSESCPAPGRKTALVLAGIHQCEYAVDMDINTVKQR